MTNPDQNTPSQNDEIHGAADGSYEAAGTETPSEPSAQGFEAGDNPEDSRTDRDPAEGGDIPEARPA